MTQIRAATVEDVKHIVPRRFGDDRGFFSETWRADWKVTDGDPFIQDNHAFSAVPNTVRGLHFQTGPSAQAKLLRVVTGAILDVAVDIRKGSPTYGQVVAAELSAANGEQLFVPHGFAHGYQTLLPDTHVLYRVDRYYDPGREGSLHYADPAIGVPWRDLGAPAILSEKDMKAPLLENFDTPFVYDPDQPYRCRCLDRA